RPVEPLARVRPERERPGAEEDRLLAGDRDAHRVLVEEVAFVPRQLEAAEELERARRPLEAAHLVARLGERARDVRPDEARRMDARKALDELSQLEERALRVGLQLILFPWATAGAIKELYGRVRELEGSLEKRDQTIRRLEDRIRELEQEKP